MEFVSNRESNQLIPEAMKKYLYLLIAGTLVAITGCKKFEHGTVEAPSNCSLCSFAESIEGTYRGEISGDYPGGGPYTDSVTMTVQQVFMNNNAFDDSTTMYFATTHTMDNEGAGTEYDTIQIRSADGIVEFPGSAQFNYNGLVGRNEDFWIRNDTINRKLLMLTMTGTTYTTYEGFLLKQ